MTWDLAASSRLAAAGLIAGHYTAGQLHMSARVSALALLGLLIAAGLYLLGCLVWPYGKCLACLGSRRNPGSNSRRHGRCKLCRGSGERLRVGTRLLLAWTGGKHPRGIRR